MSGWSGPSFDSAQLQRRARTAGSPAGRHPGSRYVIPQRVADVRLDDRLILERPGDLRLGGVDRLAHRHLHAQAALLSLGSGRREDVVLEEAQDGLGPLARLLRLPSASVASFLALVSASRAREVFSFAAFNSRFARVCTTATAASPIKPASTAAAAPLTAVRFRRAHRPARRETGSRQAVTGSSASQRSTSSASARHEP